MSKSPNYRVYCHDGVNQTVSAEWVAASNDDEAITLVAANYSDYDCELWEGRRLVTQIASNRRSAQLHPLRRSDPLLQRL